MTSLSHLAAFQERLKVGRGVPDIGYSPSPHSVATTRRAKYRVDRVHHLAALDHQPPIEIERQADSGRRGRNDVLVEPAIEPARGSLAVFVLYNTFVTAQNPNDCFGPAGCRFYTGFHSAVPSNAKLDAINTFAFASFEDFGTALPAPYDIGTYVLSHEILEWANDPFVHGDRVRGQQTFFANTVPAWTSPYDTEDSCSTPLEVADPLAGSFKLGVQAGGSPTIYVLANAVFLSWFARQSPSTAIGGLYDAGGAFTSYSTAC
jgi:hypothetical protein